MKIHHIGIVCAEKNIKNLIFSKSKKFIYKDKIQNNKLIINYNKFNKLWFEFVVPVNKKSTVYNFYKKNGTSLHHFAYYVENLGKTKKIYLKKKGYIYVGSFKINIPCFGGLMETTFFFHNNIFIEFISKYKKN